MSKKKKSESGPYSEPRRPVRLFFPEEEFRAVRMAAAEADLPMSEFCRQAVLKAIGLAQDDTRKK